jgi:MFS family permease
VLPEIKATVGGSDSGFGLALLGVGMGALPAMLGMGPIYDRYGERTVAPLLVLFALSTLLPGFASSLQWLFGALLALGALSGMLDVAINAAATAWESATGERLLNLAHASFSGFFLVASISVGLARRAGAGHMTVLVFLAIAVLLAAPLNRTPMREEPRRGVRAGIRFDPIFLMLGGLCALGFVIEGGLEAWSAVHLERTLGAGPAIGGLGPGLFAAAMLVGRTLAHVVGARLTDRQLLALGACVAAGGLIASAASPSVPLALAGIAVAGLGIAVAAPTLFGAAGRAAPEEERGSAVGTVTTVAYLGFLLGPPMVGWISGATSLRLGLGFLAVVSCALAGLSGLLHSAQRESGSRPAAEARS